MAALNKLMQQSNDMEFTSSWEDLVTAIKSGPWVRKAYAVALRTELDKVHLQPKQAVRVVTSKREGLFSKLAQVGSPLPETKKLYSL